MSKRQKQPLHGGGCTYAKERIKIYSTSLARREMQIATIMRHVKKKIVMTPIAGEDLEKPDPLIHC